MNDNGMYVDSDWSELLLLKAMHQLLVATFMLCGMHMLESAFF